MSRMKFNDRTLFSQTCTVVAAIGAFIFAGWILAHVIEWVEKHPTTFLWVVGIGWVLAVLIHCFNRIQFTGGARH